MSVSLSLLQTDLQYSALATMLRDGPRIIAFTVYGASPIIAAGPSTGFDGIVRESCLKGYLLGNGYRVYSPALMRFYSADQMSPFGRGGVNAYAYCQGDPVNYRDDSGRGPSKIARKISPIEFQQNFLTSHAKDLTRRINILDMQLEVSGRQLKSSTAKARGAPSSAEKALIETMVQLQLAKHESEVELKKVTQESFMLSQPTSPASTDSESQTGEPSSLTLTVMSEHVRQSFNPSIHDGQGGRRPLKENYFVYPDR